LDRLVPRIYLQLRQLARLHMSKERLGHTLQPTALVAEAYLKLVAAPEQNFKTKQAFFIAASRIMFEILVDHAKKKRTYKRGREFERLPMEEALMKPSSAVQEADLIDFRKAVRRLEQIDRRKAQIIELYYFTGMTAVEISELLEIGTSTVHRDLEFSRAFLRREMDR